MSTIRRPEKEDMEFINYLHRLWKNFCKKQLGGKKHFNEYDNHLDFYKGKMIVHIIGFVRFLEEEKVVPKIIVSKKKGKKSKGIQKRIEV